MINILIADDSAFMRLAIEKMLSRDKEFNVIGFCNNGKEVLEKLETLKPDVLTLDIEMPEMNGLQVLEKIMSTRPIPVIMVSSLTKHGAEETIKALELGAIDVVAKPSSFVSLKITDIYEELSKKIKSAAKAKILYKSFSEQRSARLRFLSERNKTITQNKETQEENKHLVNLTVKENSLISAKPELVVLGISTGGPASLQKIIPQLPENLPFSMIIAQHMPLGFTKTLSERLNQISKVEVKEAEEGDSIKPGRILICPAGFQTRVKKRYAGFGIHISDEQNTYLYKPCIDVLFTSASECYKEKVLGIVMTGMGNDGTKGSEEIKKHGGYIFAQSTDSCVIPSMPNSVIKANLADRIYDLNSISKSIIELYN